MTDPTRPDETDEFDAADDQAVERADDGFDDEAADFDEDAGTAEQAETGADEDLETKVLPTAAPAAAGARGAIRPQPSRERVARPSASASVDELPYVDDRVSKVWVALIAAVFALIFIYGLLLGRGGILTSSPSPAPTAPPPSASPSSLASPTTRPSVSASPVGTASPGASPTAGASTSPSRQPSPTAPASPIAGPT